MTDQDQSNPFKHYFLSPLTYDDYGCPIAEAPFTARSDTKRHAVVVPPSKVIPIVFIPGIMGSNLKLKKLPDGFEEKRYKKITKVGWEWSAVQVETEGWGNKAWRPDDSLGFMVHRFNFLEAHERRKLLDPNNTVVDDRAEIPYKDVLDQFMFECAGDGRNRVKQGEQRKLGFIHEMKRRGWGTVMLESYGPLLAFLEKNLNQMYFRGDLNDFWANNILQRQHMHVVSRSHRQAQLSDWGVVKGDKPITPDQIKKAARYWLPVHAAGYNWIQSNVDCAIYVAHKIDGFISHYKDLGYECDNVLLVTHSMGGLVARAVVHPEIGKAAGKVLGVIHGVMPTHGAAAAYRRCHAGFESAGYWGRRAANASATSHILGGKGPEVAAVFSNSPGALQLLPNKLYGVGWLNVQDATGKTLLSLPKTDPYTEIYEQKDVWWRLMNPDWVNPRPKVTDVIAQDAWDIFTRNLDKAKDFHDKLGTDYHPHTHVQYGADDEENRSYGSLAWAPTNGGSGLFGPITSSVNCGEATDGTVSLSDVRAHVGRATESATFKLSNQNEAGDGTVPRHSAAALNDNAELVAEHAGYSHQDSYKDSRAQELVAYGVVRLIAENMP